MKIYDKADSLILELAVDDDSYRYRGIMRDHNLTLRYSLAEHVELPVGAYCDFQGKRYTLELPEDFKMHHSRDYEYAVVFHSVEYKAQIWKFRNPVDGRLKFPLTATPKEHLQMFVDNMNRRDTGWTVGDCIDGTETLINYDHDFCRDALAKMASEFKTEFYFDGKRVSLNKLEVNKNNPLPLSYGRGNGFKSGVGRSNSTDNPSTEILYVQGGTQNIDRSKYPPATEQSVRTSSGGCLLLPRNASLQFDGEHFEDEDGFNTSKAQTFVSDSLGLSIRCSDRPLASMAEDSLDCSSIYPKRVGEISEVIKIDKEDGDLYDIVDKDIPDDLNYEDCIIGDEKMTIIFQSGMLAGKEFDVKYYHAATNINGSTKKGRRFEIVPQEIDGIMMPGDCFVPVVGNKYAVFHCSLPDSYINSYTGTSPVKKGAEWDMFREAVKHLYDAGQRHFAFKGTLDGIWAKKDWTNIGGRIVLGGFVLFSDPSFEPDGVRVRITGIKEYINNPHSPEIELSNSTISSSVGTTLKELGAEEVTAQENYNSAIRFTRRRFRDAQETTTMLEKALLKNFSETINPISVHAMQMLIGDEALQFQFVAYIPDDDATQQPPVVPHEVTWQEASSSLKIGDGIIKHLTLDLPKYLTSGHKPQAYHYWTMPETTTGDLDAGQNYYLYAKVPMYGGPGQFLLETTAHSLTDGNYYWLLVGVLNSEYGGTRSFAPLYGFTEILPGRVTTDRIVSGDGESYFDMLGERFKLGNKLSYNADGSHKLILSGTMVQSGSGATEYIGCYRGVYNPEATYFTGDEVTYAANGMASTYRFICNNPKSGVVPTDTLNWQVIAQGSKGEAGSGINILGDFYEHSATLAEWTAATASRSKRYLIDTDADGSEDTKFCLIKEFGTPVPGHAAGWMTKYANPGDAYIMMNEDDADDGCLFVADSQKWTNIGRIKGVPGDKGEAGDASYVHIKYANSLTEGDWTANNGDTPGKYIGIYSDNSPSAQLVWSLYTWSKIQGDNGRYTEVRFAVNGSTTEPPSLNKASISPPGWAVRMPSVSDGYYLWMTSATKSGNGTSLISQWSTPVRMTAKDGKDGKDGPSPVVVYRGIYDSSKIYYGNEYRLDVVKHPSNNEWYVARVDAGTFSSPAPPDTSKWNPFGANFESVATGLLLAENANIANLIFKDGKLISQKGILNGAESNDYGAEGFVPNIIIDGTNGSITFLGRIKSPFRSWSSINTSFIDPKFDTTNVSGYVSDGVPVNLVAEAGPSASGLRFCFSNYKYEQNGATKESTAPIDLVFYSAPNAGGIRYPVWESGETKNKLTIAKGEMVEFLFYGTPAVLWGVIVLNRIRFTQI